MSKKFTKRKTDVFHWSAPGRTEKLNELKDKLTKLEKSKENGQERDRKKRKLEEEYADQLGIPVKKIQVILSAFVTFNLISKFVQNKLNAPNRRKKPRVVPTTVRAALSQQVCAGTCNCRDAY